MEEFLGNPPGIVILLVKIFIGLLAVLWFIMPLVVISINDKVKKMMRRITSLEDAIYALEETVDLQRKETSINKYADMEE